MRQVVLCPGVTRIRGAPKAFHRRGGVLDRSPTIVETAPDHVDGLEVSACGRAPKPLERVAGILRQARALEQHPAVADLRVGQPFRCGDEYPLCGMLGILPEQRFQTRQTHLGEHRNYRYASHAVSLRSEAVTGRA